MLLYPGFCCTFSLFNSLTSVHKFFVQDDPTIRCCNEIVRLSHPCIRMGVVTKGACF